MEQAIKNIGIVVPVYNEEKYLKSFIAEIVQQSKKNKAVKQIFFVDDGSIDSSLKVLLDAKKKYSIISVICHKKNLGKGAALKTGLQVVKKSNYQAVVFIDADWQHKPYDLKQFIERLNNYPVVFGYRNLSDKSPFFRKLGNQIAKLIIRNLFHVERKDLLCGYMAFRREVFKKLIWSSNDYGVETEISTIIGKNRIPFKEINIENIYLDKNKGVNLFHAILIFLRIPIWYFSKEKIITALIILASLAIYLLLAFRNPFNLRSLVPNLEPYPDSLYYATPAWNFIHRIGFNMKVFGWQANLIVPPLYSIYLLPFFYFFGDVRSFYFANICLMIGSIIFFILLLRRIFKDNFLVIGLISFLTVTNYYLFNLPSLLMAENITLFFLIAGLNLLFSKINSFRLFLLSFWGVLIWSIKFANLPLGVVFYLLASLKIWKEKNKIWLKKYLIYSMIAGFIFIFYCLLSRIFFIQKDLGSVKSFSLEYFLPYLKLYFGNLLGNSTHYLWFREKLTSPFTGWLVIGGLAIGFIKKERKFISLQLILFIVSLVGFMSFFYAQDARYVLVILPLWLIFIGFLVEFVQRKVNKYFGGIFIFVLIVVLLFSKNFGYRENERMIVSLKKQLSLNLKYKEDPWNYIAVTQFNKFFKNKKNEHSYLGTFLPPFFVNFYTNNKYIYLPIIEGQDFFPEKSGFLKQMEIKNINSYYQKLLKENKKVYVSNYYGSNLKNWQEKFDSLKNEFKLTLKQQGCFDACNIYQLDLKKDEN